MGTVDGVQVPARIQTLWSRARALPPAHLDLLIGTAFVVLGLLSTSVREAGSPAVEYEPRDATAYVLILASTVPYYVRRRWPLAVFTVSVIALVTLSMLGYAEGVIPLMALVGAYTVGSHRSLGEAAIAGVVAFGAVVALYVAEVEGFDAGELASNVAVFGSAILLGRTVQSRRLRLEALEVGHEEAAARAVADERLRIAQEVHDVVAHSLGVIAVQAGVGSHVIDSDPTEARRALDNIARTSRESLAEIRGLLGALRGADGTPEYAPAPTLSELPRLARDVELAGLPVELDVDESLDDLPAGVGLAAYRIVQESLTNALRHAGAGHARVRIAAHEGVLEIDVVDDGRGPMPGAADGATGGHGLVGMRERVALYCGTLDAGPAPGGGFRVTARLPCGWDRVG